MRTVVQRVAEAAVLVEGETVGQIQRGLLVLVGVRRGDTESDAEYLAEKTVNLRVFPDGLGQMNLSALDMRAEVLVVSQFTLYGDCRRGRRPGYADAANPEEASRLYRHFVARIRESGLTTAEGVFGAMMDVRLVNEGPVTLLLDSQRVF